LKIAGECDARARPLFFFWQGLRRLQIRRAVAASRGVYGDRAEAIRTLFGRERRRFFADEVIHPFDEHKDRECDYHEVDDRVDEQVDVQRRCARGLRCRDGLVVFRERLTNRFEKSTAPSARPIGGIRMSLVNEVTIFPNAAPTTKPTARSITLPESAGEKIPQ
jgi:hypothetical protein